MKSTEVGRKKAKRGTFMSISEMSITSKGAPRAQTSENGV